MMNCSNCGAMGGWMLLGMIVLGVVALIVIGLVVYWAMRLAMRHERPKSHSEQDEPGPPQRSL